MGEKEKTEIEEFNVDDIYTPLEEAKVEIWRRWNDKELRKKVEDFLGGDIPEPFKKEPRAVLARPIMTPDREYFRLIDLASKIDLSVVSWEFAKDKFYTINEDKLSLAKLNFYRNKLKSSEKIVDFKGIEGKTIYDIKTKWGENLIDFHHRLLKMVSSQVELFDGSSWYKNKGNGATEYYPYFFSIFIRNGILFDNFLDGGGELKFLNDVVRPAFQKVLENFGVKPLIVELIPHKEACDETWWAYPNFLEDEIKKIIKNSNDV